MNWHARILLTLALTSLLVAPTPGAAGWDASKLAEQLKAHINERLYNTCKAVVLVQQSEDLYTGYAEFLNGVKVDLEVAASDGRIEYVFVKPQPKPAVAETIPARIEELEAIVTHQEIEIARLRDLCHHAGIDANAIETNTVIIPTNQTDILPERDASEPAIEDQTTPEPEPIWFTRPAYDEIRKGMTTAQVAKKFGGEGKLIGNSDFDRALNETYIWVNPDDSHACIVFRNGKVLVKTQFGLPTPLPQRPALETP